MALKTTPPIFPARSPYQTWLIELGPDPNAVARANIDLANVTSIDIVFEGTAGVKSATRRRTKRLRSLPQLLESECPLDSNNYSERRYCMNIISGYI